MSMKLSVIETGLFKLDGGAMFGVVPKSIWEKLEQPDENNLCTWAMRCLLIEQGDKKILIDTGIGNKQNEKFFSHYHLHGNDSLDKSLRAQNVRMGEITDVLLTHLHFDHVGGAVTQGLNSKGDMIYAPAFSNARYWSNQQHFNWAANPNPREAASFLKENFMPLRDVLNYVPAQPHDQPLQWMDNIDLQFAYGHTEAMMLPRIHYKGKTIVYCADLLPSPSHLGAPYVMGYDIRPLETMTEKEYFLNEAIEREYILFFEHSAYVQACTVMRNEKGRIVVKQQGNLSDFVAL